MLIRTLPGTRKLLTATSTTELFEAFTGWYHTLEVASAIAAVLILANKTGNFQFRFGIQTATTETDDANAALNPSTISTQITAVGRSFVAFDPKGASDGNIDIHCYFRVGVLYSLSSGSTPAQGLVGIDALSWR